MLVGASAAEAPTNTINQDIDGRMARTRTRALPSRRLSPAQALALGCVLVAAAFAVAVPLDVWTGVFLALGVADNVVVAGPPAAEAGGEDALVTRGLERCSSLVRGVRS